MQISQTVLELQSGHDFVRVRQIDGQTNRAKTRCLPTLRGRHNNVLNWAFQIKNILILSRKENYKITLTQFRLSSHDLAIERGRYENLNRREIDCKLCDSKLVENEYHLLLVCPFYRALWQKCSNPTIVVGPRLINLMMWCEKLIKKKLS